MYIVNIYNIMSFTLLLLGCLLVHVSCADTLIFVAVVARHGARTMENPKYFNITKDVSFMMNPGKLTDVGKHQLYLLGRQLGYKYIQIAHFISNSYQTNEIFVRSSGLNRTIESVQGFLSGFYNPGTGPRLNTGLIDEAIPGIKVADLHDMKVKLGREALPSFMQLVPVHTTTEQKDYIFNAHTECIAAKRDDLNYKDEINKMYEKYAGLSKNITDKHHLAISSIVDLYKLYDNVASVLGNAGKLSVNFNEEEIKKLREASIDETMNVFLRSKLKIKLMCHGILSDVAKHFKKAIAQEKKDVKNRLKLAYFQMSDAHILALSKLLEVEINEVPFASSIIFELIKSQNKYSVKIYYNQKEMKWKGNLVNDYEGFANYLEAHTYKNDTEFIDSCLHYKEPKKSVGNIGTILFIIILVVSILGIFVLMMVRMKQMKEQPEEALAGGDKEELNIQEEKKKDVESAPANETLIDSFLDNTQPNIN